MKKIFNKKTVIVIIFVVILILLLNNKKFDYYNKNKPLDNKEIPREWLLYENKDLGISMKYPKQIMGEDIVFFQIGMILLVTTNSSSIYTHRNEITSTDPIIIKKQIWEMKQKYETQFFEEGWQIWISDVNNDTDLNNIIQKWFGDFHSFGNGCKLGIKSQIPNKNNYYYVDVDAVKPNEDYYSNSCPINWRINFEYSPEYKRAVIWDMDQEDHFYFNNTCINNVGENNCSADELMKDSFRFIEK